jgi:hypothetical protein
MAGPMQLELCNAMGWEFFLCHRSFSGVVLAVFWNGSINAWMQTIHYYLTVAEVDLKNTRIIADMEL